MSEYQRSRKLLKEFKDLKNREKGEELLRLLPQGEGSGLDADTVDKMHAEEIIEQALARIGIRAKRGQPVFGGGGGMKKHGNEFHTETYLTEADLPDDLSRSGSEPMAGNLSMDGYDIIDVGDILPKTSVSNIGSATKRFYKIYGSEGYITTLNATTLLASKVGSHLIPDIDYNPTFGIGYDIGASSYRFRDARIGRYVYVDTSVLTDQIDERVLNAGVTIDNLLIKDGAITSIATNQLAFTNFGFKWDGTWVQCMNQAFTLNRHFKCYNFASYDWYAVGNPSKLIPWENRGIRFVDNSGTVIIAGWDDGAANEFLFINRAGDITMLAGKSVDAYTNNGYIKLHRVSQAAQPTPQTGEALLWRDTDDDKTYLVLEDPDVGTRKVELT